MLPGMAGIAGFQGEIISGGSLSAVAAPNDVSKTQGDFGPGALVLTTPPTTVTVSGGAAPFTHAWARISGDATITATAAASATTAFTASVALGVTKTAVFRDTVTDANGAHVESNDVNVTLDHVDYH